MVAKLIFHLAKQDSPRIHVGLCQDAASMLALVVAIRDGLCGD